MGGMAHQKGPVGQSLSHSPRSCASVKLDIPTGHFALASAPGLFAGPKKAPLPARHPRQVAAGGWDQGRGPWGPTCDP